MPWLYALQYLYICVLFVGSGENTSACVVISSHRARIYRKAHLNIHSFTLTRTACRGGLSNKLKAYIYCVGSRLALTRPCMFDAVVLFLFKHHIQQHSIAKQAQTQPQRRKHTASIQAATHSIKNSNITNHHHHHLRIHFGSSNFGSSHFGSS